MNSSEINQLIEASAKSIRASVQDEMALFADNVRGDICNKIADDVCDQVCRQASERIRGPALFRDPIRRPECPWEDHFTPLPDEYIVASWRGYDIWGPCTTTCTNYGRIILQKQYDVSQKRFPASQERVPVSQKRAPGMKLTSEIIGYIRCIKGNVVTEDQVFDTLVSMLNEYDRTYAFAHHNVHSNEVKAIRAEIKQEISDEFAKLSIATTLLKARQEAFDQEIARRERELSQRELSAARSRISMIEQQLSQEIANVGKQVDSFVPYQDQWESLLNKLVDCKKALADRAFYPD